MTGSVSLFRRQVRIPVVGGEDSVDARMVRHLELLEASSPHIMQEWMRSALRQAYIAEQLAMNPQTDRRASNEGQAKAGEGV